MKNKNPLLHTNVCMTTIMILTVAASPAETVTWDGITDLSWTNPDSTSWTGGTYDNGDDAQFLGSGAGTVTLLGTINPGSITVNSANNYAFAGSAIGGAGTLTKDGTGTLSLKGTVANTYSGGTTINAGTISLGASGGLDSHQDALGSGTVTVNSGADLKLWISAGGNYTIDNAFTLDGGTVYSEDGQYDLTGTMTLNAGGGTLGGKWGDKYLQVSGVISGTGDLTIEDVPSVQTGDVILSGVNTYTGDTTITSGNLEIGEAGQLGSGNYAGSISNSGTLEYNSSANQTLSGVISGTGALIKDNTSTVTLSGTVANTYSGGTTINDGTLNLGSGASEDALGSGTVTVNSGGSLQLHISAGGSYTIDNAFTLDGGTVYSEDGQYDLTGAMTLNAGGGTLGGKWGDKYLKVSGVISGTGGLTIVDVPSVQTGDVILTANNNFTGGTTVDGGTLTLTGSGRIGNGGLTVNNGGTLSVATNAFNSLGGAITVNEGGTLSTDSTGNNAHNIGAIGINGGTLTSSGNAYSEGNWIFNGDVTVGGSALSTISGLAVGSKGGGGTFNVADSVTGSGTDLLVTASMVDASGGSFLTKTGAGTMTLSGTNTYTGTTTINQGTLELATSKLTFGHTVIIDGATDGTATMRLTGSGGGANNMLSDAAVTIQNGGTLDDATIDANVQSMGTITFNNGGTMSSSGASRNATFGNYFIKGGVIVTGNAAATIDATELSLNGTQTFNVADATGDANSDLTISSEINEFGGGSLTKTGAGTMELTSANTYTGTTTVNAGTLSLATGSSHSGSGAYTVNGGILEIATGVDLSAHAMTIGVGGVISPGNSPGTASTGTQTWNDGGSYLWEINDSDGSKGGTNGWDWLDITGALDLSALTIGGFTIDIDSLTSGNIAGDAVGFDTWTQGDGNSDYSFIIATASSGITGFDAADFILDSSGFSNAPSWEWGIVLSGGDLVLEAYAVPEPSSTALLGLGGLALMLRRKRS